MPVDGLAGVGVCVLAVIVVLLLPHIVSSAPVLEIRQWVDSLPSSPYPCSCGEPANPNG
jgi:hypothetical protein